MTVQDWQGFYRATDGRPPRRTLLRALSSFAAEGRGPGALAVDLGCGIGRDTLPLLRSGWRVLALDRERPALDELARRAAAEGLEDRLEVRCERFEAMRLPAAACDLVNASFSLFACRPGGFPRVWRKIVRALPPGGRFAGQVLGPRDSWAGLADRCVLERAELDLLLAPFDVEAVEEEETDSVTPLGEAKHWHIWHVNARRAL